MRIDFDLAGEPAVFTRDSLTGQAEIQFRSAVFVLQNKMSPNSHLSLFLRRKWRQPIGEHEVRVEHVRPLLLAYARPNAFSIFVDEQLVASQKGL